MRRDLVSRLQGPLGRRARVALTWGALGLGLLLAWALPGVAEAGAGQAAAWVLALATSARLVVVGALAYLALSWLRRWSPAGMGARAPRLNLLETRKLGPRQALHLVQVEDRKLLIGATEQQLSLLASWEADVEQVVGSDPAPSFARWLATARAAENRRAGKA